MEPGDRAARRIALDGADRRRIYLFRHGDVDYLDAEGNVVPDTNKVALSERGQGQALAMRKLFEGAQIDKVICSGIRRTRQTAETVVGDREIDIESYPEFEEIQQFQGQITGNYDIVTEVAFTHWRATEEAARFLGGERYSDFYDRIGAAIERLLADSSWHNIAVFAHGGTNAAVLGWVTGLGLSSFGLMDQATCCLNVIDIDVNASGDVVRKTIRAMNVTVDDPAKGNRKSGDMETMARWLLRRQSDSTSPES